MDDELLQLNIAGLIIASTYEKLIKYSYGDMEECPEFIDTIEKIKQYTRVENELYSNIGRNTIDNYFASISKNHRFNNSKDARMYNRMSDRMRELNGSKTVNGILISSIISSKLIIDNLHYVNDRINELVPNEEIQEDDILMINLYNKRMKYHYLTANSYIEKMALEHNFSVDSIPSYTFQDIENKYGIRFISAIQEVLLNYVKESIYELANLKSFDKYLLSYSSLFEIGRVEAILPYLDITSVDKILELYKDDSYKYDSNAALRKVKKIIYKKKEEFN